MTIHYGDVPAGSTLYIPFQTFDSAGASVTLTGLATSDIKIYKNGSITQRSSTNGFTLLDTDGIDFDGLTGIHGFSIDLSDNTDAGFYSTAAQYWVIVDSVTVDSQTVRFIAATFSISALQSLAAADAVLDEDMTAHQTAGTLGRAIGDPGLSGISMYDKIGNPDVTLAEDITSARLEIANVAGDVWNEVVDATTTARESLRLSNSALGGKLSGAGTGTEVVRDLADSKNRLTYTVDNDGNRSAVTRDLS